MSHPHPGVGMGWGGKGWDEVVWCGDVSPSPHPHTGWEGWEGWVGCNGVVSREKGVCGVVSFT
jgi:hypothetical protein